MYSEQPDRNKEEYLTHLVAHCALSSVHSNSKKPFLEYRVAENEFCQCFNAENVSRSDVAVDAVYKTTGIGIKTFVEGTAFQKIAEFDKKARFNDLFDDLEIVREVSKLRNNRLDFVIKKYGLEELIYHYIVRYDGEYRIFECPMDYIDIDGIKYVSRTGNTIQFTDGKNNYKFSVAKSTISMEFPLSDPLASMKTNFIENVSESIVELYETKFGKINVGLHKDEDYEFEEVVLSDIVPENPYLDDAVILPLYSVKKFDGVRKRYVPEKSGLNQWNASGRPRDPHEIYIPVPRKVHTDHPNFFPPRTETFRLMIPGGKCLNAKLCQSGDKGLMSNPNKDLGIWLLSHVFNQPERKLLTYEIMEKKKINAVRVSKLKDGTYYINFIYVPTDTNIYPVL